MYLYKINKVKTFLSQKKALRRVLFNVKLITNYYYVLYTYSTVTVAAPAVAVAAVEPSD